MLEDESGRLRLVGIPLQTSMLVTGCIIAVMGTENANGDFEIIDLRVPDLARQPQRWERDDAQAILANGGKKRKGKGQDARTAGGKVAIVSGLGISGDQADIMSLDLFMEYLLGEAGGTSNQAEAGKISRLFIVGNSILDSTSLASRDDLPERKVSKKYGYDSSTYNPAPTTHFDYFLLNLLPSIPITLIPGETDPANVSLPQQPIHPAMFQHSRRYTAIPGSDEPGWFDSVTNPWEGDVDGWRMMGNGGQPVDDIFKYIEGDDRLEMMEHLLRWRCGAPTAPDTLCTFTIPILSLISPAPIYKSKKRSNSPSPGLIIDNGAITRVLPIPRHRPLRHRRMPPRLLRRQPTQIRNNSHRRPSRANRSPNRGTQVQRNRRGRGARYRYFKTGTDPVSSC